MDALFRPVTELDDIGLLMVTAYLCYQAIGVSPSGKSHMTSYGITSVINSRAEALKQQSWQHR